MDLSKMQLPAPESETDALDLSGEQGLTEEKSPLSEFSDQEILEEAERRNLIEPEEVEDEGAEAPEEGPIFEDEDVTPPANT